MYRHLSLLYFFCVLSLGCAQSPSISAYTDQQYQKYKANFNASIIEHFPNKISSSVGYSSVFSATDKKKNDFSLILYEYEVLQTEIDLVKNKFKKIATAQYKSSDSCLLIVNRFETKESYDSLETPVLSDLTLINKSCYSGKYPIPNFVNFKGYRKDRALRLDDTFVIYVIESKRELSQEKEFDMEPAEQMPDNWKNGYSKGVAISATNRTVIYWTVIW